MIRRFGHTLHLCFRPHLWLLYAVSLAAAAGIAASSLSWPASTTQAFLTGYFEVFGTIAVTLGLHHVLTIDADDGAREALLTYPGPRLILALERVAAGFALAAGPLLLVAGCFQAFFVQALSEADLAAISLRAALSHAAPSWVFLAGLALLASALTGSWLAGLLVSGVYWVADLATAGAHTAQLHLFYGTFSPGGVSPGLNRLLLSVLGASACAGAALLYGRIAGRG